VHFIIGSPSTHKEYLEWGFPVDQVTVVNYCVNKEIYWPDESNVYDLDRIGYFGRLKKYKSVDHLLQAMDRLRDEYPRLHLDIIGDGDDKSRLEELSAELKLQDRVTFHGFIDESEKAPLLQKMNFVVNTSSKEGWGLTVVEANACGAPVVAANVPGLRDSVVDGETGLLYEFGNIDDLVTNMRVFLDSVETATPSARARSPGLPNSTGTSPPTKPSPSSAAPSPTGRKTDKPPPLFPPSRLSPSPLSSSPLSSYPLSSYPLSSYPLSSYPLSSHQYPKFRRYPSVIPTLPLSRK
jgi:hypothetical protein